MKFSFEVKRKDGKTRARAGIVNTPHGKIETPAFSPVATKASVKSLSPEDLRDANTQIVLGNTYHLYLRPGVDIIDKFGGFAPFMGWDGPTITDSGGYQVSFIWPSAQRVSPRVGDSRESETGPEGKMEENLGRVLKITDEGALFSSYIDGTRHQLTPEKSVQIQKALGADMIMALDQPLGLNLTREEREEAFERTLKWEERSFAEWERLGRGVPSARRQALFGIIQGEVDKDLRRRSLRFLLGLGFPGLAMGGESIGSNPKVTARALDTVVDLLPDDKPLHALGLGGGPEGIFTAVERGVDIFDNSSVTRMARTGLVFIYPEDGGNRTNKFRLDLNKSKFRQDKGPISKICKCYACANFSKAYTQHLLFSNEVLGLRLASIHNIYFVNNLMALIRAAIDRGSFVNLKEEWLK